MSFYIAINHGRITRAIAQIKRIESYTFTEKELRGLTAQEKEFIRDLDYRSYVDIKNVRYYMFIARDLHGKKHLYAYNKRQVMEPNGHDISESAYNYECWLTFSAGAYVGAPEFSRYYYERRFCTSPTRTILVFI